MFRLRALVSKVLWPALKITTGIYVDATLGETGKLI